MKNIRKKKVLFFLIEYLILFLSYNFKSIINMKFNDLINLPVIIMLGLLIIIYLIDRTLKDKFKKMKWLLSISILIYAIISPLLSSINILNYIFVFYFLIFISFIIHELFNYNFSISLGISTLTLVLILFLLSLFNLLIYTKVLIGLIIIVGIFYLVFKYKRKSKILDDINSYIDPTLIIFALFFLISIVNGFQRYVHYWDEYNMWGLSAKKVILSNSIAGFSYPPIMALWSYFVSLFDTFRESNLYIANSIYIYIFIMSLFSSIKNKKTYILLFLVSISFYYLFNDVYSMQNLYADFPSAVVFGFGLIVCYFSIIKKKMPTLLLLLPSAVITLMKPQGFALATCLIFLAMLLYSVHDLKWNLKLKIIKKNIIAIIKKFWYVILPIVLYLSWVVFSNKFLVQDVYISNVTGPSGLSTHFLDSPNMRNLIIFIANAFNYSDNIVFSSIIPLSLSNYFIFIGVSLFLCFYAKHKNIKKSLLYMAPFMIVFICYFILTSLSLLVVMPIEDALNLSSFTRYLGNFNLGIFMFLLWLIFKDFQDSKKYVLLIITGIILISVPISKTFSFVFDVKTRSEVKGVYYSDIGHFSTVLENTSKSSKIYVLDQEDKSGYLPMCKAQYYLYPRVTNANGQINWKIQTKDQKEKWMLNAKSLEKTLIKNKFDYLFLYSSTDELFNEISYMAEDKDNIEKYKLFKIDVVNNSVSLKPVE